MTWIVRAAVTDLALGAFVILGLLDPRVEVSAWRLMRAWARTWREQLAAVLSVGGAACVLAAGVAPARHALTRWCPLSITLSLIGLAWLLWLGRTPYRYHCRHGA